MSSISISRPILAGILFLASSSGIALAHPHFENANAAANKTQILKIGVSHGCEGDDTLRIRVEIPAGVTSVRALRSDFGKPTLEKVGDVVTAIVWQKPDSEVLDSDYGYPVLEFRVRIPDAPFTTLQFNTDQTCRSAAGVETLVRWNEAPGGTGNTAPTIPVVPARTSGWNKFVLGANVTVTQDDLPKYLADAQIVWRGSSAYSSNPNTHAQIMSTSGVTLISGGLQPNDEIWVRY